LVTSAADMYYTFVGSTGALAGSWADPKLDDSTRLVATKKTRITPFLSSPNPAVLAGEGSGLREICYATWP
jgi:hypothetical protein